MARPRLAESIRREVRYAELEKYLQAARELAPGEIPPWYALAACQGTDPEAFYPGNALKPDSEEVTRALGICNGDGEIGRPPCPVRDQCLAHAMERPERYGIWGGMTPAGRRNLRKARYERARQARAEARAITLRHSHT
jgi:WhiB family transcriptional regulator, redox-sensing transcriptional regulator